MFEPQTSYQHQDHSHDAYDIDTPPALDTLETVAPLRALNVVGFNGGVGRLDATGAAAILREIWRLTRNGAYLHIEHAARDGDDPSLHLATHADRTAEDGTLKPTAAARSFIETVRRDYAAQLS